MNMRKRISVLALAGTLTVVFSQLCAEETKAPPDELLAFYTSVIDQTIDICRKKMHVRTVRSDMIQLAAARYCLKAAFFIHFKEELIQEMMAKKVHKSQYMATYFLNSRFYNALCNSCPKPEWVGTAAS